MNRVLEFWYEFASTYSYLSVMRIEELADQADVRIIWKPFLLGPIFKSQGWDTSPFNIYHSKGSYMWRDIERLADKYGVSWNKPSRFPQNGLLASRVALVLEQDGLCQEFSKRVFRANFIEDRDISDEAVIYSILDSLGLNAENALLRAKAKDNKDLLRAQTEQAVEKGIFGAPTFVSGDELFWGNDRLEDALAWACSEPSA